MLLGAFCSVWPIHPHFLLKICPPTGSCSLRCQSLSLPIFLGHQILKMQLRQLVIKVWIFRSAFIYLFIYLFYLFFFFFGGGEKKTSNHYGTPQRSFCTVEPRSTDTRLLQTTRYNGHVRLSQRKAHIYSLKLNRILRTSVNTDNGHFPVSQSE